jgi:hypothetical protein
VLRRLTLALALACSLGSATTAYAATAFVWPDALEPSTATGAVTSREFVLATYSDPALLTFQQPIAPTVNAGHLQPVHGDHVCRFHLLVRRGNAVVRGRSQRRLSG